MKKLKQYEKDEINKMILESVIVWLHSSFPKKHVAAEILSYLDAIGYENKDNVNWRKIAESLEE